MFTRGVNAASKNASTIEVKSSMKSNGSTARNPRDSIKEERHIKKSRRTLDGYLRKVAESTFRPLKLNLETGTCSFSYQRFIIVIEIPVDQPETVFLYTCVCRVELDDNISQVMQTAMELNYLQDLTRGASLGFKDAEVNLCRLVPLSVLNPAKLRIILDEFLTTASESNTQLEHAKRSWEAATIEQNFRSQILQSNRGYRSPPRQASNNSSKSPTNPRARTYTK